MIPVHMVLFVAYQGNYCCSWLGVIIRNDGTAQSENSNKTGTVKNKLFSLFLRDISIVK